MGDDGGLGIVFGLGAIIGGAVILITWFCVNNFEIIVK